MSLLKKITIEQDKNASGTDKLELLKGAVPNPVGLNSAGSRDQNSWLTDSVPSYPLFGSTLLKRLKYLFRSIHGEWLVVSDGRKRIIRLCYYNFCSPFERQ